MTADGSSDAPSLDRRAFLKAGAIGIGARLGTQEQGGTIAQADDRALAFHQPPAAKLHEGLVDVNVYVSRWPFRRLRGDETRELVATLREGGVREAWTGSFDGVFHRDLGGVNARLADECQRLGDGLLVPFGAVNPKLPDWEEDLRRCHEVHRMPGIRLHPNYHQYGLGDSDFARLLDLANERGLIVQVALSMEDERTQHPLMLVPHVDVRPLVEQARKRPNLKIVLINGFRAIAASKPGPIATLPNVSFDVAMLESVGGVERLFEQIDPGRVLFGSYAPFFYFESARLKLKESSLSGDRLKGVGGENARRLRGVLTT